MTQPKPGSSEWHIQLGHAALDNADCYACRVARGETPPLMSTDFPGQPFGRGDTITVIPAAPQDVYLDAAQQYAVGRNRDEAARRLVADPMFRAAIDVAFAAGRAFEVEEHRQDSMSRD